MWTPENPEQFDIDAFTLRMRNQALADKHAGTLSQAKAYKNARARESQQPMRTTQTASSPKGVAGSASAKPGAEDAYTDSGKYRAITLNGTRINTLEGLVTKYQVDTDVWECTKFSCNTWNMGAKLKHLTYTEEGGIESASEELAIEELYATRAEFKKLVSNAAAKELITSLIEELKSYAPSYAPINYNLEATGNPRLLEISVYDHHFGKLAHKSETGQNYELKKATLLYDTAVNNLLARAMAAGPINQIVFVVGNDLLQMDSPEGQTTSGTKVDCDSRFFKVYETVIRTVRGAIERMRQVAPVHVALVPGNHDRVTILHLGFVLGAIFANCQDVTIDNTPTLRKYYRFGENMFLYTHGSEEKVSELPLTMATEQKLMWGQTTFRFVRIGHLHKKKTYSRVDVDESFGVQTSICPSLCATDAWHAQHAYIGNIQRSEAWIYDSETGNEGFLTYRPSKELLDA